MARSSLIHEAPAYQAKGQISGTLARSILQADAMAKGARARANGTISPFAWGPVEHLDVQASGLDPHYFRASAPAASFGLTLTVDRDADGKGMKGALTVTNATPGALDTDHVPVAKLEGKMTGVPTDLAINKLLLDLGAAGTLAGGARLRDGKLDLDLVTRGLNLNRLHGRLHPTELAGTIQAKAAQDQQRFLMKLTQKDGRIDANARLRNGELTVKQVRASAAGGSVDRARQARASRAISRSHSRARSPTSTPRASAIIARARINSRFDATGTLAPILQLKADLDVFDSQINGIGRRGQIRWRSKGTQTPDIAVDLAADVRQHARSGAGHAVRPASIWANWTFSLRWRARTYPICSRSWASRCRRHRLPAERTSWSITKTSGRSSNSPARSARAIWRAISRSTARQPCKSCARIWCRTLCG